MNLGQWLAKQKGKPKSRSTHPPRGIRGKIERDFDEAVRDQNSRRKKGQNGFTSFEMPS